MLPPKHRLAKTTEITTVTTRGRRFFNPLFALKVVFKPDALPRFAFVVSTKVSKRAVVRNRIRRVLRETVQVHLVDLKPGDYVVIVKASAVGLENKDLADRFQAFLRSIKVSTI